jgi:hypothetical protein
MMIASKYEDIYPPFIKDFIYVTDQAYSVISDRHGGLNS